MFFRLGRNKIETIPIVSFVSQYEIPQFNVKHKSKQKGHKTVLQSFLGQKCSKAFWGTASCFGNVLAIWNVKAVQGQHMHRACLLA